MATTIGVIGTMLGVQGAAATVSVAAGIGAALEIGMVAGSMVYQAKQKKKAKAAAARLKKEADARARAARAALKKLEKGMETGGGGGGVFDDGTFSSASGARDITEMVRRSTASRRIVYGRARLGGIWIYPETTGASNETLHMILALCEGPVDAIETVFFDDEPVTLAATGHGTGKWAGSVYIRKHLGTPGDPAEPELEIASALWTPDHRLEGIAYIYVRLSINLELWTAIPEISAVVHGKNNILDPRTGIRGYSVNPALCLADYLTTKLVGPGIDPTDIDQPALMHAADVCDQVVQTHLGPEPRFACQGALDLSQTVEDNALLFVQAMNGDLIQTGGLFIIQAGEYIIPTFTLDAHMLAGPIEFSNLQPRKARSNMVKGTFLAEANNWQKFDFPAVIDHAAIEQDGQEVVADVALELVGSGAQAQRLASMELKQARRGRSARLTCNLKAMPAIVGSNVIVDIPRYFDGDIYRVVEYQFSIGNDSAPNIQLTLVQNEPEIYDWSISQEKLINVPPELSASSPQCVKPVMTPDAEPEPIYPASIAITSATAGAVIRYSKTVAPSVITDGTLYTGPVTVVREERLYARAFRDGYLASPLALEFYTAPSDPEEETQPVEE